MLTLTFFATSLFFRHKKDSGSWSIYNKKKLYPEIHILVRSLDKTRACGYDNAFHEKNPLQGFIKMTLTESAAATLRLLPMGNAQQSVFKSKPTISKSHMGILCT